MLSQSSQAARCRPLSNSLALSTIATNTVEVDDKRMVREELSARTVSTSVPIGETKELL